LDARNIVGGTNKKYGWSSSTEAKEILWFHPNCTITNGI
jgi:hypothetical protein